MQYKLYDKSNKTSDFYGIFFQNRGIENYKEYLNLDKSVVLPYEYLDNMQSAVSLFMKHFEKKSNIGILVDTDPDGYCSAAMMYMYIKQIDRDYPITYIMHNQPKAHGFTSDVIIPDTIEFLIIPDASTNDVKECEGLKNKGIDILILDHHEKEKENPYALIINNQVSDRYINKSFCGAGIVYRFLQALDDENWYELADNYLDLCALANISDNMDMRSYETKYLTEKGLLNINNKCFQQFIKAQDYSMGGKINIHNVQWYITPVINGCIRFGKPEEKELLFKAFIEQDEIFEYKKRATKDKPAETIKENIYERAVRLSINAKTRQDKQKDKGLQSIIQLVNKNNSSDKVIMLDATDILEQGLTGLVAAKVAETFNKPCILLSKYYDTDKKKELYKGSARNFENSPIENLKNIVNSTSVITGIGHPNAFGIVDMELNQKDKALESLNSALQNVEYNNSYLVDFIFDVDDIDVGLIADLAKLQDYLCKGISKPMLAVQNVSLTRDQFEIIGKNEDTINFVINDIKYIQFKCKEGNSLYDWLQSAWDDNDSVTFDIVGSPTINEYKGIRTPQINIEDNIIMDLNNDEDEEW